MDMWNFNLPKGGWIHRFLIAFIDWELKTAYNFFPKALWELLHEGLQNILESS